MRKSSPFCSTIALDHRNYSDICTDIFGSAQDSLCLLSTYLSHDSYAYLFYDCFPHDSYAYPFYDCLSYDSYAYSFYDYLPYVDYDHGHNTWTDVESMPFYADTCLYITVPDLIAQVHGGQQQIPSMQPTDTSMDN